MNNEQLQQLARETWIKVVGAYEREGKDGMAEIHSALEKAADPRDTKRLDWVLDKLNDGYWPLMNSKEKSREAIDAAMSQEGK